MDEAAGGRDYPEDECPICKDVFRNPVSLQSCSHVFCRTCLTESLKIRNHCPICRGNASGNFRPAPPPGGAREQSTFNIQSIIGQFEQLSSPQLLPSGNSPAGLGPALPQRRPAMLANSWVRRHPTPALLVANRSQVPSTARLLATRHTAPQTPPHVGGLAIGAAGVAPRPPSPATSSSSDDEDLCEILEVISLPSSNSHNPSVMTFQCPYCQESGLDELDLVDHCNQNHRNDMRPVVCPICVALPHGDPSYQSRDFLGHLNLRHRFYTEDFMNVGYHDAVSQQAALLESYSQQAQNGQ